MKIRYQFVDGEVSEIEVDDALGEVLLDLDRQEYNNNQTETRRHCSLEALNLDEAFLPSDEDVEALILKNADAVRLQRAIMRLSPVQQALVEAIFFKGISVSEYAKQCGVSQPAMTQRKATVLRNLKKFLE